MIYDFILDYDGAFSKEYCESLIQYFLNMEKMGFTRNRNAENKQKHIISDTSVYLHGEDVICIESIQKYYSFFSQIFWEKIYKEYVEKYSILNEAGNHQIYSCKIQRTKIGEAYHGWHNENTTRPCSGRILTFILYLNDVKDGGETEFLYYPKRIKPEQGKIIMFPGSFTHTHRGNQPLSNEKYIITGWLEL